MIDMQRGAEESEWGQLSWLAAALINAQLAKGQTPVKPWDLNPLNPKNRPAPPPDRVAKHGLKKPIHALKVFLKRG